MEEYREQLKKMSNEELLDEISVLNAYSAEDMTPLEVSEKMCNEARAEILSRLNIKKDLEKAFEDGRLFDASELELNLEGRQTVFEAWYEDVYVPSKTKKI